MTESTEENQAEKSLENIVEGFCKITAENIKDFSKNDGKEILTVALGYFICTWMKSLQIEESQVNDILYSIDQVVNKIYPELINSEYQSILLAKTRETLLRFSQLVK
jgi:hypothetical protein